MMHCDTQSGLLRRRIRGVGAALLVMLPVIGACTNADEKNTYAPPPPPEVDVAHPLQKEVTRELVYTGQVTPEATVELRARVQGFLEEMAFKEGQRVKKGDLLYVIDERQYKAAVDRAKAQVEASAAALEGARNDAKLADELAAQNAGPRIDAIIKAARRDAMAAQLASEKAALENAKLNLEFCRIHAPMDGRMTESKVDLGNLVGEGAPTYLASLVETRVVYVNVDVSESDVLMVRELLGAGKPGGAATDTVPANPGYGQKVYLTIAGHDTMRFNGEVNYIDPQLNQQTGTLRVRSVFPNADEKLLPGLFVSLHVPIATYQTILIPDAALLSDQSGRFALVVDDTDTVQVKRVKVGERRGSLREVTEGLQPSDRVVVLGVLRARPGSKVTPKAVEIKDGPAAP
ncbi:MAG: efflux RND transporter periplasmic adaptor subunit [Phycisphaerales bacterium]